MKEKLNNTGYMSVGLIGGVLIMALFFAAISSRTDANKLEPANPNTIMYDGKLFKVESLPNEVRELPRVGHILTDTIYTKSNTLILDKESYLLEDSIQFNLGSRRAFRLNRINDSTVVVRSAGVSIDRIKDMFFCSGAIYIKSNEYVKLKISKNNNTSGTIVYSTDFRSEQQKLHDLIDEKIHTNGRIAITAEDINEILHKIVNEL